MGIKVWVVIAGVVWAVGAARNLGRVVVGMFTAAGAGLEIAAAATAPGGHPTLRRGLVGGTAGGRPLVLMGALG